MFADESNTQRSTAKRSFRDAVRRIGEHAVEIPTGIELQEGWLTQFGTDWFRDAPEWEVEYDVSVFLGKMTLTETAYAMFGRPPADHHRHRHFDVVKLVAESYRCLHTPRKKRPQHASILAGCPDEDIEAHKIWWADPRRTKLHLVAESGV